MCNKGLLVFGVASYVGAIASLVTIVVTAGALNAFIFTAPGAIPFMHWAVSLGSGTLGLVVAFKFGLDAYYSCMLKSLSPGQSSPCLADYELASSWLSTAIVALSIFVASVTVLLVFSAIPFVVTAATVALLISLGAAAFALLASGEAIGKLIGCLEKQTPSVKKTPLTETSVTVFTCPLNTATCGEGDLKQVQPNAGGVYTTSPSLAVNGVPKTTANIISITATVTDSFNNAVSLDPADLYSPNTHAIGDPNGWIARLDWAKLGTRGLRLEPSLRRWTITLEFNITGGKGERYDVSCNITT
ncbi:MAG: hypothetical protein JJ902_21805 [Roseibium sp.]|nr:hypothetical protein [Roseibium sp.]